MSTVVTTPPPPRVKSLLWDFCLMSAKFTVIYWRHIPPIGEAQVHQIKLIATLTLTGHWMHHAGPGAGKATHVPEWGIRADAGLLAERTPAENGHQRHPQQPADAGQESSGLPGHPGLKLCSGFRIFISMNLSGGKIGSNVYEASSLLFQDPSSVTDHHPPLLPRKTSLLWTNINIICS